MKVSVIVPVYNVEKYLRKCLDSLVNQTLKDIEIIIVNDGSPDNSQGIINEYVKKYPKKIKSYIQENGGQGAARNFALKKAKGKYIGFVDSDDYISLDMYEKMYNKIEQDKADIVICNNYIVNDDNIDIEKDNSLIYGDNFERAFFGKMAVWNKLYKKDLIVNNKIEFAKRVWYEDLAFTVKTIISANKITFVDEPLYYYIIREGSTMNNNNVRRNTELFLAFDDLFSYLKKEKKLKKYYSNLEFLAIEHIYISGITRVIQCEADKNVKKEIINEFLTYFNNNFKDHKKNKYLKNLTFNRKLIYILNNFRMFFMVKLIFKIKGKIA